MLLMVLLLGLGVGVKARQGRVHTKKTAAATEKVTAVKDLTGFDNGETIPYENVSYEEYKKLMADSEVHGEYSKEEEEEDEEEENALKISFDTSKVAMSDRTAFLFPNGVPTSASGCYSYTVKVTIPITNPDGSKGTTTVRVHKKLAEAVRAIFQELSDINFPVASVGGYCYRMMASGTGHLSHHSYGVCIDLNAGYNPPTYWGSKPNKNSKFYCNEKVQAIFKKYGFYWGGNWSEKYYDPMHFTYTNH